MARCSWCNRYFEKTKKRKSYCSFICRNSKSGKYREKKSRYIRSLYWSETQQKTVQLRSSYELTYVLWLEQNNIKWLYEPRKFRLEGGVSYLPDFYLPDTDEWIEVKGKFFAKAKKKYADFQRLYPEEKIKLVLAPEIMEIRKSMGIDAHGQKL